MPDLTINGYKHHYEDVGQGAPLLCVYGTRDTSAAAWVRTLQGHAQGFRIIMPDLRGMADSEHTTDVKPENWVEDLGELLDSLSLGQVHLAGIALGTRIVTRFAAEHPQRVRTLVLSGAIAYSNPTANETRLQNPTMIERMRPYHGEDAEKISEFYLKLHAQPAFQEYYDLRKIAGQVKVPVLVMRGDVDDNVHPLQHSAELHALFSSSWLAIYPNTRYNPIAYHPDQAWALIDQFVKEVG